MSRLESFTPQEVNDAIGELKACLSDLKRCSIPRDLEQRLPRFAYLFRHDEVLVAALDDLPKTDVNKLTDASDAGILKDCYLEFPADPRERLSFQIGILMAIGEHRLSFWDLSEERLRKDHVDFWEDIFHPTLRDLLRYAISLQGYLIERQKNKAPTMTSKTTTHKKYSLELFISHSSKDEAVARALVEFLRAALGIPHDKVRCTSVEGYKLSAGVPTEIELRREVHETCCLIGLITPNSIKSPFVLFELGARWGSGDLLIPLVALGYKAADLRPPLSNLNVLCCTNKPEMHQLVHNLAELLEKKVPLPATYNDQLSSLLELAKPNGLTFFG